jgi:hypothetical protein
MNLPESGNVKGMHLNNHLPPLLPCRSLSAHTRSLPWLPPSLSSPLYPVDSNRRAACNRLGVVGHRLLDPNPANAGYKRCGEKKKRAREGTISPSRTTFSPRMRNSPHHFSANVSPAYIRSTVSSRTRFANSGCSKKKKFGTQARQ